MSNALRFALRTRLPILFIAALFGISILLQQMYFARRVQAVSTTVVISQVYGGGGNAGSTYKNDFIELFNRGNTTVNLTGWSVQYASATGTTWSVTNLTNVTLQPGKYYLVQEALGAGGTTNLPTPDATGTIAMSATAGKVALVNNTTALSGSGCPFAASVIDFVGFGSTATCSETAATPAPSNTNAVLRASAGCADTDSNSADFATGAPTPRNTASALNPCTVNQPIVPNCPTPLNTIQGTATSANVGATDQDGRVTSASITSANVPGITLDSFVASPSNNTAATATLNVAATTAPGNYNVTIQYSNNDPTPQTATCTVVVNVATPNQQITPNCPTPLNTTEGTATSEGVSATDPDGRVTSASITGTPVTGITLDNFVAAPSNNTAATATLNVAATTAAGTYNVTIQYSNDDSPTPQTATCTVVVTVQPPPVTGKVVISQVYGGGGNTGSTLKNDYIELINHSSTPISLNGWSVQVLLSGTWLVTPLTNFTLQPGQYYLVQESQGAGGTDNLPTPDAVGTITVSSTSGKVALVNSTTALTGTCPSSSAIVDFVGYGPQDCFEGSGPAPLLSNTTAALRLNSGCFDTNDNAHDFVSGSPTPHNSSSATNDCTALSGFGAANPSTVLQGDSTTLTVYVAAGQNPASTGITVTADLSTIGGSANQAFSGSGTTFTFNATVPSNNAPGMKSLPVTITDAQARSVNTSIVLSVLPLIPDHITISQVYGGGGNSGATFTNDYVELYNPTASTITITGWTLQYASATGTSWTNKQPLGGVIGPGQYYLVSLASGGGVGVPLPVTPNISGNINMSATTGKIVLVRNSDSLSGACPLGTDSDIVDFVGYGTTANCHEGNANTPAPGNAVAIFRANNGARDTDQNGTDFSTGTPNPRRTEPVVELGPWVAGTDPISNDFNIPYDASVTVNFSEPVNVDPGWYNISCVSTGLHNDATIAHTNDFKTYAITPNTNFQFSEQCTVTINKTAVHDQDNDDSNPDTDTLLTNETWSFSVVAAGQAAPYPPTVHLTMGNPSNATASLSNPNNYLMEKPSFALSYNRDKGIPNWASWHLDTSWSGTLTRVDTFRPDPAVDPSWYRVQAFDYFQSGFDRGHNTPNADRDHQDRIPINQETFLMSNMIPQAPDQNQGPWANMENDLRTIVSAGNEMYIVMGGQGAGGTGNNGYAETIANGKVTVPNVTWKVIMVLPTGVNDVSRVTCSSRTIAVIMPNSNTFNGSTIRDDNWQDFLVSVDQVESLTGYDFYSNLPPAVQSCVEGGVNGTNPPGTANQSATTAEETPVTITLQALQSNSNPLTFSIVSGPSAGSLGPVGSSSCSAGTCTATVTYTPGANFSGPDSFTFKANDGTLNSTPATVNITVTQVNDNPIAVNDNKQTPEDSSINFPASDLTGNDSPGPNEAGQTLTVDSIISTPNTHGSILLSAGQITYTPDANYNGPASFDYQVCDNGTTNGSPDSKCTTATVNMTVTEVNDAPTAVNDTLSNVAEDSGPRTILASTLMANDSPGPANESGQTLSINTVSNAVGGTVSIVGGNVVFTPTTDYNGPASFDYQVCDNGTTSGSPDSKCTTATVNMTVTEVNDAPTAVNDTLSNVAEDSGPRTILASTLMANDSPGPANESGQTMIVKTVGNAVGGTVGIMGGNVVFTPTADYSGPASFDYMVEDNGTTNGVAAPLTSGTATASFNITEVNDAPNAVNDVLTSLAEDSSVRTIPIASLLGNDSKGPADESGQTLSINTVSNPVGGTVSIVSGNVVFTPTADYSGPASFQYTVEDNGTSNGAPDAKSDTGTVSFSITEVNDAPDAVNDALTSVAEDSGMRTISIASLLANDSNGAANESGQTLSFSLVGGSGVNGTVTSDATNVYFTPTADFNGPASFQYMVTDNGTTNGVADPKSDTATLSFTVWEVNDVPVAVNDTLANMAEDSGPRTVPSADLIGNDSPGPANESAQPLFVNVGSAVGGTVILVNGIVTFTPAADYFGPASFEYTIEDNGTTNGVPDPKVSAPGTASFTITEVNDAPTAVNDTLSSVAEDSGQRTIPFATLTANDSKGPANESGQTLIVKTVSNAIGGTVSIVGGNVLFTPTADFNGPASFAYTVEDNGTTNGVADPKTSGTATVSFNITAQADAPSVTNATTNANTQTTSGLVISRNPADGAEVTHFKITGITGGTLFKNDGVTPINNGDFITFAEGNAGLKFTPGTSNGSFTVQASLSASDAGLQGGTATATITVNPLGGVISFSAANYSVAEGAGFTAITVERTGDASQPVTVDYASSDHSNPADFIPCTAAGAGLASSRCDFTTAVGTLRFAAGETTKTFNVLISQDNYVEGTETLSLTLSNPTGGAVFGVPAAAILSITDDATEPATNPIDNAGDFVRQQYHDVLNREPDGPGLAFWTDNIEKCNDPARRPAGQTVAQCIDKQRESTAIAFFMSPEFQMTDGFVYRLYKGSLTGAPNYDGGSPGRFPTSLEFIHDVSQVAEGVVVNGQISGAVVEANRNRLAGDFVQRPEFLAKYGGLDNTLYVQELFNTTGIAATAGEKQALVDGLTNGTETRASVLRKIVDGTVVISEGNVQFTTTYGQAFYNQEFQRVFVFMEYVGFLRRNPDAPGFNFWLGKLNQFNGDPFQAEMVRSFILSPEYRSRFGQP